MTEPSPQLASLLTLFSTMEEKGASDLFVTEGSPPALRIHGEVLPQPIPPIDKGPLTHLLDALLSQTQRARFDETGDLDVGYSLKGRRFRINLARQRGRIALVARALPTGDLDLAELGLPDAVGELAQLSRGLVLVTGATGSGKSTTLAALVNRINATRAAHVVTIEDPIEFLHTDNKARITQREVGADTLSFAQALRHAVRQDPDVILIGEMRDLETMQVALAAALTGHLVVSTLHTIDASQTLQRILSYFPQHLRDQAAMDLSMSLKGLISQRLVPSEGDGARVLAYELMTATPPVMRLIREQRIGELQDLMRSSDDPGISTFNHSLLRLHKEGKIAYDVGYAYATNPDEFALAARGMSTGAGTFQGSQSLETVVGLDMKALLQLTLKAGASDLHLAVDRPPILRVNGDLRPLKVRPLTTGDMRTLLHSILGAHQREVYQLEREIDFALSLETGQRFRVNAYYQKGKMAAALRIIPTRVPEPEELGLPNALVSLGLKSHGLLLVVGPTGSGKSTTLACLIDQINKHRACRIITVEDPIEYVHRSRRATIDQREVHADTRSFAAALKYVLRQDPDVILVGEMRDLETIGAALTAAETGHLVLATLHTNDAIQAIDRMVDVFPSHQQAQVRAQLASSLLGVVSQRLLQRADKKGRIAAFEIMVATPAMRHMVRENKMHQAWSAMETGAKHGMNTMDTALKAMVKDGTIHRSEASRFMRHPHTLGTG